MPPLGPLLSAIVAQLCAAIGAFAHRRARTPSVVWLGTQAFIPVQPLPAAPPVPDSVLALACARLARLTQRLTRLYDQWRANTLPKLRPSRAGRTFSPPALGRGEPEGGPSSTNPPKATRQYLPRRHAWLAAGTDHHVRGHAAQIAHVLTQPDAKEFIAAVPRSGRLLRPLYRMLGLDLPAPLILPPRPRKPRKPKEKPPQEPRRHGKYTVAQARRYSPGRIPTHIPGRT